MRIATAAAGVTRRLGPVALRAAAAATLAVVAGLLSFHSGRRGFLPLDQSIVFDGGWRLLSGQVPFVDFVAPAALVPSAMQALIFRIGGITMTAYAVHAAMINAAFALVAVAMMRRLGASHLTAWLVGGGSAVVFYPPMGLPYADQHSFFFSLCALYLTVVGLTASGRRATIAAACVPVVATLAWFSKPIPALFVCGPAVIVAAVVLARRRQWLIAIAATIAPLAAVVIGAAAAGVDVSRAWYYAVTLPQSIGFGRLDVWPRLERMRDQLASTVTLTTPWLGAVLVLFVAAAVGMRAERRDARLRRAAMLAALAVALSAATFAFAMLTNKNVANAAALLFVILGLSWLAAAAALPVVIRRADLVARAVFVLGTVVAIAGGLDTWRFHRDVNLTRAVNTPVQPGDIETILPGRLSYLRFSPPYGQRYRDIQEYLATRPLNFLLIGDASFLYAINRRPSVAHVLWLHPGLTIPPRSSPEFDRFETEWIARLPRFQVRFIIEEPGGTRFSIGLATFPRLAALVDGCPSVDVGGWTVHDVCR